MENVRWNRRRHLVCTLTFAATGITPVLYMILVSLAVFNSPDSYPTDVELYGISGNTSFWRQQFSLSNVCSCHLNGTHMTWTLVDNCLNKTVISVIDIDPGIETDMCSVNCCSMRP